MSELNHEAKRTKSNQWWTFGALGAFLLTKGKALGTVLLAGKYTATVVSMFLTIAALGFLYEWDFAVGVVAMLFAHELGHVVAARRKGLPVTAPVFIPFVGALILFKRNPRDAVTEAYIAMGGPVVGTAAAVLCWAVGYAFAVDEIIAASYVGFAINLLNLIPIHPLDGGRIAATVTRWLWLVGLALGFVLIYRSGMKLLYPVWALFAIELFVKYGRLNGRSGTYSAYGTIETPLEKLQKERLDEALSASRHEVPFSTYSTRDGRQRVRLLVESVWLRYIVIMPEQGIIHRVLIQQPRLVRKKGNVYFRCKYRIVYTPHEDDGYYRVPAAVRWRYGLGYAGLAGYLMVMMYWASTLRFRGW